MVRKKIGVFRNVESVPAPLRPPHDPPKQLFHVRGTHNLLQITLFEPIPETEIFKGDAERRDAPRRRERDGFEAVHECRIDPTYLFDAPDMRESLYGPPAENEVFCGGCYGKPQLVTYNRNDRSEYGAPRKN